MGEGESQEYFGSPFTNRDKSDTKQSRQNHQSNIKIDNQQKATRTVMGKLQNCIEDDYCSYSVEDILDNSKQRTLGQ